MVLSGVCLSGGCRGRFVTHILSDLKICSTKTKGKIKRKRAKTPNISACGGLKGHYNSSIQSVSVKNRVLIIFGLKSPRSGEFFWGCFLKVSGGSAACPEGAARWTVLSGGCLSGGCLGGSGYYVLDRSYDYVGVLEDNQPIS